MLWWTVGLHPDAQTCVETRGARQYGQSFSKHKQVAPYFILFLIKIRFQSCLREPYYSVLFNPLWQLFGSVVNLLFVVVP